MLALFIIWKYFSTKRAGIKVNENLSIESGKKEEIERLIIENEAAIRAIEQAVAEYHASGKNVRNQIKVNFMKLIYYLTFRKYLTN